MSVKNIIETKLESFGFTIGCYDPLLEKLSRKDLENLLSNLEFGSTDIVATIKRRKYVIEVFQVDNEIDFNSMTKTEYFNTYGRQIQ